MSITIKTTTTMTQQNELRISMLPGDSSYDTTWPCKKVALRCTPHHILYHYDVKVALVGRWLYGGRKEEREVGGGGEVGKVEGWWEVEVEVVGV